MPKSLYERLSRSAKESRRSLTQEAIILLEKGLESENDPIMSRRSQVLDEIAKNRKLSKSEADMAIRWIRQDRERP